MKGLKFNPKVDYVWLGVPELFVRFFIVLLSALFGVVTFFYFGDSPLLLVLGYGFAFVAFCFSFASLNYLKRKSGGRDKVVGGVCVGADVGELDVSLRK